VHKGSLFVISAPSGTGKTSLVERLVQSVPTLVKSRSYTARSPRQGETRGVDYSFVSRAAFESMVNSDQFLEWANVFGNLYGTSKADIEEKVAGGLDVALVIDVNGARQVRLSSANATTIFILPPSPSALESRLRRRSQNSDQEIQERLSVAREEVKAFNEYDFVIINDDFDAALSRLKAVVTGCGDTLPEVGSSVDDIVATFELK
ncbi:uncharacterized protein METZ01_LOCUS45658, partial [marine metagenome]